MAYGKELIIDIHNCQVKKFKRKMLKIFFIELCKIIKMEREDLHFWDYNNLGEYEKAPRHLKGISAVQFIKTSNITIHTLDDMKQVYLNIFSCKNFNKKKTIKFCRKYFKGDLAGSTEVNRL